MESDDSDQEEDHVPVFTPELAKLKQKERK